MPVISMPACTSRRKSVASQGRQKAGFMAGKMQCCATGLDHLQMFTPSQTDVREFFCVTHAKSLAGTPLTPLETVAAQWISEHPEHHAELVDLEAALTAEYKVDGGRANPFLHLSMHLTISEQVSIDQPRGIRQAVELPQTLATLARPVTEGSTPLATLEARACQHRTERGWQPDYLTARRRSDLGIPADDAARSGEWVALGAARIGATRLIDNLEFGG